MTQLPTALQQFIHTSKYARWNEAEGRRESWSETVDRYIEAMVKHIEEMDEPNE